MKKRWLSLALCLALLLSLAPGALAADAGADTVTGTFTYCPALGMVGVPDQEQTFTYSDANLSLIHI